MMQKRGWFFLLCLLSGQSWCMDGDVPAQSRLFNERGVVPKLILSNGQQLKKNW